MTDFYSLTSDASATLHSGTHFVLGPTVEFHFPAGVGVEFDALYRRLGYKAAGNLVDSVVSTSAPTAWEFPLLLKYRVPGPVVRPFLDAGVAFDRWSGVKQITNLDVVTKSSQSGGNTGLVLGGGIELHAAVVRISPEIRFTHWGSKDVSGLGGLLRFNQNQAEFLIGITF